MDEFMSPYYGHLSSKQFIHGKYIRIGFKMMSLIDLIGLVVQFLGVLLGDMNSWDY